MMSPAREHFLRTMAAQQGVGQVVSHVGAAPATPVRQEPAMARLQSKLVADQAALSALRSVQAKIDYKRELLPGYVPYVQGVLETGKGADDAVAVTVMVWCLDVGDWQLGLDLAAYALKHKLTLPERFTRPVGEMVLETVAEAALNAIGDGTTDDSLANALERAQAMTDGIDMPDQIRAKAEKAAGHLILATGDKLKALEHLKSALTFNRQIGVTKLIQRLEKEIREATASTEDAGNAG